MSKQVVAAVATTEIKCAQMRLRVREKGMLSRFLSQSLDRPRGGGWIRCSGNTAPVSTLTILGPLRMAPGFSFCTSLAGFGSTATIFVALCRPTGLQQTTCGILRAGARLPASRDWAAKACAPVHMQVTASAAAIRPCILRNVAPNTTGRNGGRGARSARELPQTKTSEYVPCVSSVGHGVKRKHKKHKEIVLQTKRNSSEY